MKTTIKELVQEMKGHSDAGKERMIREYCHQVIDECAGNFECTMEYDKEPYGETMIENTSSEPYPVLVRASVLVVKNMLI